VTHHTESERLTAGERPDAQGDEDDPDEDLEPRRYARWNLDVECEKQPPEQENRQRVADTPRSASDARARLVLDECRDRGDVVRFQRVSRPEGPAGQESGSESGEHERESVHGATFDTEMK
jgi:hypothetical protein